MRVNRPSHPNRSHRVRAGGAVVGAVALATLALPAVASAAAPGTWTPTATTPAPRFGHNAVRLNDGRVLVAGGVWDTVKDFVTTTSGVAAAQIYDPVHDAWATAGSLLTARERASAVVLADGRVLLADGLSGSLTLRTTEIFNPANGTWGPGPSTLKARADNAAIRLGDGRVLVAGIEGAASISGPTSAEIFNPRTNRWTATGATGVPSAGAGYQIRGVLLPDGRALTTLGMGSQSGPAVYNPATNAWQRLPSAPVNLGLDTKPALLPNGRVLFAGGVLPMFFGDEPAGTAAELDPVTGIWTTRPTPTITSVYDQQQLVPVAGGKLLLGGGVASGIDADYLYDPATATWSTVQGGTGGGLRSTLTALADGRALTVGGDAFTFITGTIATAKLFQP